MAFFPILVKPRLLTLKNRWFRPGRSSYKEYAALAISLGMMAAIFFCTLSALKDTSRMLGQAQLTPQAPLSMVLTTLALMLLLSASVTAIGALFLSRDLDLILSSPFTPAQFLIGKICEVTLASSWMLIMFGLPSLAAFGYFFEAHLLFYLLSPLVCAFLLLIPSIGAVLVALLFGALISPNRGREVFLILFLVALGGLALYLGTPYYGSHLQNTPVEGTVSFVRFSTLSSYSLSPTFICATALRDLMRGDFASSVVALLLFAATCGVLGVTSLFALRALYERAYTRAQSQQSTMKINSRNSQRIARTVFPFMKSSTRSLVSKEFKVFSRDISHTVQLGMLLAICFVYLYNFRVLRSPENLAPEFIKWWQAFLMLCNTALSSMVIASICTRFVFPSVSLEGASYWVLQCSPISEKEILRTKFRAWFIPLATIGSVVFISGALALNAEGPLVLATCVGGIILSYGLVGLSIGLGAMFCQFDWEYSAQVSTTLGSFLFMFSSILILLVDMVPLGLMFASYALLPEQSDKTIPTTWLAMCLCLLVLLIINKILASWALAAGARSLQAR